MNLKQLATLCFLVLAPLVVNGQDRVALLAVECEAVEGLCEAQSLVRFHFNDGVLVSKDVILTAPVNRISYNFRQNHIYRNRYVITRWADVVDIQKKELLYDGNGDYVGTDGDKIIQRVDSSKTHGYFYYDLATRLTGRLAQPGKWALRGTLSPDQTKSVEGQGSDIWLHRLNGKKQLLGNGFYSQGEEEVSSTARPPVFWLDDARILSQRNNGEIVVVQLDGTITPVVKIAVNKRNYSDPHFFRDRAGRIVYECCGQSFAINVEEKSYTSYEWATLGFGFEAENTGHPAYGHIIRYQGKEIARVWASVWGAPAIDGYVAFEYGEVGSNLGYPKGIKVWSSANRKWTTIDLKRLLTIVGWVSE